MKQMMFVALLSAVMLAGTGCEAIKNAASKDFSVKGVKFAFNATVEGATRAVVDSGTRTGEANPFSVTRTVSLADIGSSELTEYKNMIDRVKVDNTQLQVTVSPSGSYTVTELKIAATGVAGSPLAVPSLSVGGTFSPPAGIEAFTSALVMKLVSAGSVEVTVSGVTDAPAGATLSISYDNDLTFTASVL